MLNVVLCAYTVLALWLVHDFVKWQRRARQPQLAAARLVTPKWCPSESRTDEADPSAHPLAPEHWPRSCTIPAHRPHHRAVYNSATPAEMAYVTNDSPYTEYKEFGR